MKGAQWMDIRSDRQKGLSYVELGKKYHMDQRTAKRYAESLEKPKYTLTGPKPSKLDRYKQQIDQWLEEAPYSAVRILEKLQEEVHRICNRYEHKHNDPVSSERISVLWRVSGGDFIRQYEESGHQAAAETGGLYTEPAV